MWRWIFVITGLITLNVPLKAQNESDDPVETRAFQLSLLPSVGTEGVYAFDNIYNLSLNIFAGLTGGVDGLELGGFVNINRYTMHGFQAAGFGNIVNGNSEGFQAAGLFNVNNLYTSGLQAAGFVNIVNYDAKLVQVSGFANIINGTNKGLQGSGFVNVVSGNAEMIQAAGFVNIAGGVLKGVQAAGFTNVAREIDGLQAAGFVNVARNVKGLQIGFVNVADSIDGLPIGFISVVREGYRKVEFSAGDAMNLNLGFKIGVKRFYNLLTMGAQFTGENNLFLLGYGIGTELNLAQDRYLNVEILSNRVVKEGWLKSEQFNMLNQLKVNYAADLDSGWQIFVGPVLNIQVARKDPGTNEWDNLAPYSILDFSNSRTESRVWIGINAGLRFW